MPLRGQVTQAKGAPAYAQTQDENTVIRAPVTEPFGARCEKGEFLTTMFVGDKGAKGGWRWPISTISECRAGYQPERFCEIADKESVVTMTLSDQKYDGIIYEISPEANRQKATVQVKVKVKNPDDYLRPEMNSSVAFVSDERWRPCEGRRAR